MSSTPPLHDWLDSRRPLVLGLFRIVLGLLFASEGAATVFGVLDRKASPVGDWPFWYAGVIELTCGVLVLLGVATRSAAFLSSGIMAFAYFTEHQKDGLFPLQNGGLAPVLFCWGFLLLVFAGPGALSLAGPTHRETGSRTIRRTT
ncbi:DoxX family protein [Streptomyces scabiei]|uniref:DoxX family protein n=1 Tax=Streptomyces scabiei TaxID=1930 RepID=UPI001B304764|nr:MULTISPECIES: DoxX family protein [Streptomyces]MBP5861009.1 DoxX family protein [Streptomyces sp. LBUM 1484]MBP5878575.1 DoxX family protein [Streptomyces sp. LBUM 1477]MBP5886414.1 DoxX family protein [Streptomyces sp. LBUM 1487]MBP5902400.1 DoxX family protein [Streptomyces sp. LBUM 1488]MDW8475992.1 DoxX family protein [Streptomyces scabiei]